MYSTQLCSRRFDFLRLHQWAWKSRLLRSPLPLSSEREDKNIFKLMLLLINAKMKQHGIRYKVFNDPERQFVCLEFYQPMQLLTSLVAFKELPGQLQWEGGTRPDRASKYSLIIPLKEGSVWFASSQYKALEKFIECKTQSA